MCRRRQTRALGNLIVAILLPLGVVGCPAQQAPTVLPAESARVAFQSPCAQNVIECTSSWPVAVASVAARHGQTVTETDTGFLVRQPYATGSVSVSLVGDQSTAGQGATQLNHTWSYGAIEDDPCTLTPGQTFASEANPSVELEPGFHYIRLTVENDIIRPSVESPTCGVFGENIPSFDFVELEIEVRNW